MVDQQKTGAFSRRSKWALGSVLVLMGAWFGYSAFHQWQGERVQHQLESARDTLAEAVAVRLDGLRAQTDKALSEDDLQRAMVAGDARAMRQAVARHVEGVQQVALYPDHLSAAYADPAGFGWSQLALLEQAALEGGAVARVVRDQGSAHLGVAAPVTVNGVLSLVYLRLPVAVLGGLLDQIWVPGDSYLGIRQGRFVVAAKGDMALADSSETLARVVPNTALRLVGAVPETTPGPMGMGPLGSGLVAVLLLLIAGLVAAAGSRLPLPRLVGSARVEDDGAVTFDETLAAGGDAADLPGKAVSVNPPQPIPVQALAAKDGINDPDMVPASIFRAYDIRGVVGKDLHVVGACLIGQAIGSALIERGLNKIVVARDGRLSSEELSHSLIAGLQAAGSEVVDIGLAPSPMAYFAAHHLEIGSCVVVTGSHNPPEYNGFKVVLGGETLSGEAIGDLHSRIKSQRLLQASVPGTLTQQDVTQDYIDRIAGDVQLERPLKVVVDAGNGVAGLVAPALLEAIGAEVIPLYCDVDGTFPNHHPDPSEPANLEDLIATVKRFNADVGLAFDGDGDRLGMVTPDGKIIFADRLLMLFAADVLMRNPGAQVIYDVKCTSKLSEFILLNGGSPLMWKTGHSLIKAKMRETDAELAGEMSGHFFFRERWYGFDDGIYAAARLLEILAQSEDSADGVLSAIPESVATPELKVPVEAGSQHALVALFAAAAQSTDSPLHGARLSTVDGLRADYADGWGLLRASNTTSVLVLRFEGEDEQAQERIRQRFREQLEALMPGAATMF